MNHRNFNKWVTCPKPSPSARIRLFCFPFAGGGASTYRTWGAGLASVAEVCPVQVPGREERYSEPSCRNLVALARAAAREIVPFLDKPFAFFGHSMGALLSFEITRALRHSGSPMPVMLLLAAYPPPHEPLGRTPMHLLSDGQFIQEMRRLQGTSEAVLQNAELMQFLLPILRADFEACDTYEYRQEEPLECPIFMYGGTDDNEVGLQHLEKWRQHTRGPFEVRMFAGTHFFIQSNRALVLSDVESRLRCAGS